MSEYSGDVDLEVGRHGLRTFSVVPSSILSVEIRSMFGIEQTDKDKEKFLGPVFVNSSREWITGTCVARCYAAQGYTPSCDVSWGNHLPPSEKCKCGIYATLSLNHLQEQYPEQTSNVVAIVAAEGQTIIGTKGFRTARATVVAYWCDDSVRDMCKKQFQEAQEYGDVLEMVKDFNLEVGEPSPQPEIHPGWTVWNTSWKISNYPGWAQ